MKNSNIANPNMAREGKRKIDWVRKHMPILNQIESEFIQNQPFNGLRVLVCVHLEAKTAYLAKVFASGGATVSVTGSNALSTKDDVAAALVEEGLFVYAKHDVSENELTQNMNDALDLKPNVIIDDGGDIIEIVHDERPELLSDLYGACEETTSGVERAIQRANKGELKCPVMLINNAQCKMIFDNYHGTGQSVWDGIMRTTNLVVSGKTVVVIGFGWCGKGVADRAKGLGANVIVCEIDPIKAVDATMHGYQVMPLLSASEVGDIFLTITGKEKVLRQEHFKKMKNGAMIANAGHFNTEIDLDGINSLAIQSNSNRENIDGYQIDDDRWIYVLGNGNLVNIACADGHPAEIMDTSFALQALSALYVVQNHSTLTPQPYPVPEEIDQKVARLRLAGMGVEID